MMLLTHCSFRSSYRQTELTERRKLDRRRTGDLSRALPEGDDSPSLSSNNSQSLKRKRGLVYSSSSVESHTSFPGKLSLKNSSSSPSKRSRTTPSSPSPASPLRVSLRPRGTSGKKDDDDDGDDDESEEEDEEEKSSSSSSSPRRGRGRPLRRGPGRPPKRVIVLFPVFSCRSL